MFKSHKNTCVRCLAVCVCDIMNKASRCCTSVCDIVNKASMCCTSICYITSQSFYSLHWLRASQHGWDLRSSNLK